jgi:hypothetical protein
MNIKKHHITVDIGLIMVIGFIAIIVYRNIQYYRILHILHAINPQQVTLFRIYPNVIRPVGNYQEIHASDPLVTEFFQSLTDTRSYY